MINSSIKTMFILITVSMLLLGVGARGDETQTSQSQRRTRDSQSDIYFYGKLVDQNENPVNGAKIIYEIEKYGLFFPSVSRKSVKTGKDGMFKIRGGNAAKLRILDAILDGYEYLWKDNEHLFEYRSFYNSDIRHTPDNTNPIVIHTRKRESECCCILETCFDFDFKTREHDNCLGYDLFTFNKQRFPQSDSSNEWDLEVFAENDPENQQWFLIFRTTKEDFGIQKSEKQWFMAPVDGYVNDASFSIQYSQKEYAHPLYLFIKTDSPTAFFRLDIKYTSLPEHLRIRANLFMNPYGERLLESVSAFTDWRDEYSLNLFKIYAHDKKFDAGMKVYTPIKQAAKESRKKRKMAEKPDISQYLKEGILIFTDRRHYSLK